MDYILVVVVVVVFVYTFYRLRIQGSSNVVLVNGSNPPCNKKVDGPMGQSEAATRPSGVLQVSDGGISIFSQRARVPSLVTVSFQVSF